MLFIFSINVFKTSQDIDSEICKNVYQCLNENILMQTCINYLKGKILNFKTTRIL